MQYRKKRGYVQSPPLDEDLLSCSGDAFLHNVSKLLLVKAYDSVAPVYFAVFSKKNFCSKLNGAAPALYYLFLVVFFDIKKILLLQFFRLCV